MLISQQAHCALIIVIELASHYESEGISLEEIAERHYLPAEALCPIAQQLCAVGIISCKQMGNQTKCLFLERQPDDMSALDIVQIFDSEVFMGKFLNETNGKWLPQSRVARHINYERKQYLHYVKSKLRKINIKYWCEQTNGATYSFSDHL